MFSNSRHRAKNCANSPCEHRTTHSNWVHTTFRLDLLNFETVFSHPFNKTLYKRRLNCLLSVRRRLLWRFVCNCTFMHIANYRWNFDRWHTIDWMHTWKKDAEFIQLLLDACRCNAMRSNLSHTLSQLHVWLTYIRNHVSIIHWMEITSTLLISMFIRRFVFPFYAWLTVSVCVCEVWSFNVASVNDKIVIKCAVQFSLFFLHLRAACVRVTSEGNFFKWKTFSSFRYQTEKQ